MEKVKRYLIKGLFRPKSRGSLFIYKNKRHWYENVRGAKESCYMSLEQIKKLIEENKEDQGVRAYLQGLNALTVEGMQKFVEENQEAKKWLDSINDKFFNKALETWKSNNLDGLLDAEIKKRFPQKDQKDLELENMKAEIEKMKAEKLKESLTNKAIKIANEKKLPLDVVDFLIADNEEATVSNLSKLEEVFNKHIQVAVEERLKNNSYVPPGNTSGTKELTKEDFDKMGYHDRKKLAEENPDLYKKLRN